MNEKTSIQPRSLPALQGERIHRHRHSETLEDMVVYRQEYGEHGLWVRPKQMFSETVQVDGQEVPRFRQLASSSEKVDESVSNIFDDLPPHLPKEVVQTLIQAAGVRIERIVLHGHASAPDFWYDQGQAEWVIVLKGAASCSSRMA